MTHFFLSLVESLFWNINSLVCPAGLPFQAELFQAERCRKLLTNMGAAYDTELSSKIETFKGNSGMDDIGDILI